MQFLSPRPRGKRKYKQALDQFVNQVKVKKKDIQPRPQSNDVRASNVGIIIQAGVISTDLLHNR